MFEAEPEVWSPENPKLYDVDNGVTEEQMPRNVDKPCTAQDPCTDNSPVQTDDETYEIVQE